MKRLSILIILIFLVSVIPAYAISAEDAENNWIEAKEARQDAESDYRKAKIDFAVDSSEQNEQKVIDTAKDMLNSALDEAEAWLIWKRAEANENEDIPESIELSIEEDVDKNLEMIDELRADVDSIESKSGIGLVFLKMIIKYRDLLTDVARNNGYMWVHIARERADTIEDYQEKLREATADEELLEKLDVAKEELDTARSKIDLAEKAYDKVESEGTPFIKFAEGNAYLRQAKRNLMDSYLQLQHVYSEIVRSNK